MTLDDGVRLLHHWECSTAGARGGHEDGCLGSGNVAGCASGGDLQRRPPESLCNGPEKKVRTHTLMATDLLRADSTLLVFGGLTIQL